MASKPIRIPNLAGGLDNSLPRDQRPINKPGSMQNFTVVDGVLEKRTGSAAVTGTLVGSSGEPFLLGHHYEDAFSALSRFWAFSRAAAMEKELVGSGNWTDRTNSMYIQAGDDQYFSVAECVDFTSYKNHLLVCQNHNNHLTALNGARGGDESVVWYTEAPTTGLSKLEGADGYNHATGGDVYHRAKQVLNVDGFVFLLNTYERVNASTWAPCPQRARWSNPQEFKLADDWNPSATGSLAGYRDLRYGLGSLMAGVGMGNNPCFFLERGIVIASRTDSANDPWYFQQRVRGIGLYGPRLFAEAGGVVFFVGSDKQIYRWWGGMRPDPIGNQVKTEFFSLINKNASGAYLIRRRGFCIHLRDIKAIDFYVPTTGNFPDTAFRYFYDDNKWEKIVLASGKDLTGAGEWYRPVGISAENLPIIGDNTGKILQGDYATMGDDTGSIDAWVVSPTIIVDLMHEHRVTDIVFDVSGDGAASSVDVEWSNDDGGTWSNKETVTVGNGWEAKRVSFDISGYQIQVRFRNQSATQKLKLGQVVFDPEPSGEVT